MFSNVEREIDLLQRMASKFVAVVILRRGSYF
jgi:hypothetical protein